VKETKDSDDPLARKRTGIFVSPKSTQSIFAGVLVPIDFIATYDLIFVIFLFLISLFLSGIRAAYAASGAMENPWERKSDSESQVPTRIQQLALSLIQRAITLLALLLAARLAWMQTQSMDSELFQWILLGFLAIWVWLDAIVRYNSARKANDFIPKIAVFTPILIKIC